MNDDDAVVPPDDVQRAFGATGSIQRFQSGEGNTFRVGLTVLKPVPDAYEAEWIGGVLSGVVEHGFRVARPIAATNGSWVFDGWTAWQWVAGESTRTRWDQVIAAGEHFHAALREVPRPDFLDRRSHQWDAGDRAAFGESGIEVPAPIDEEVARLRAELGRLDLPSQVIHGDLTENVLLADGLAPAIIDFSPYYRPAGFAGAVVVVDAIVWLDAPRSLVDLIRPAAARYELLARALIYRLVAAALPRKRDAPGLQMQAAAYQPLVDHTVHALRDGR